MALNYEVRYSAGFLPGDANYPIGVPKNSTTETSKDGAPWDVDGIKDWHGFFQGLLSRNSISPSGNADTVNVSDYLDALGLEINKPFVSLSEAVNSTNKTRLFIGAEILISERVVGEKGGFRAIIVDETTVTTNPYNIIACAGLPALAIEMIIELPFDPTRFGITIVAADNSAAWQALLDIKPSHIHFTTVGSYTFLLPSTHDTDIAITSVPGVIIDCTDAGFVGVNWTKFSGAFPQIEDLGVNAVKGARTLTFVSPPTLVPGDVFVIFNPTNSSWSLFRTNYFAGEFCRVVGVSGSVVTVAGNLYDDYAFSAVDIYRLDGIKVAISDLEINGDLSSSLIDLEFCRDSLLNNIKSHHKNNSCISIARCFNTTVTEPSIHNEGDGGDDYGIAVTNSQTIKITGGDVYSRRHSITTGGDASAGAVPCRDLRFSHITLSNDVNSGVHNADFHGNTEDSSYEYCKISGGATWQGKNIGYIGCEISETSVGSCILSAEIIGGRFYAVDCDFKTFIDPSLTNRSIIDVGGNSDSIDASTVDDCLFELLGCTVDGKNLSANTSIANFRNRGSSAKISYRIDDLRIDVDNLSSVLFTDLVTGSADSEFIIVDNIVAVGVTGKLLVNHSANDYLPFSHRLQKQAGSEELTTSAASSTVVGTPVVFNWIYPKKPTVTMSRTGRGYFGNRIGIAYADPSSISGLTPAISSDDATNFAAALTFDINWAVEISEI